MGRHAHRFSRPSDTRPHPAGPTTTRRTRPRRDPVPASGAAAVPAPRRPPVSPSVTPPVTRDAAPAGDTRPGPRAAEAMLSPQALLGWGAFASTIAALTVVALRGTPAHALAVAALGLSATVLLGWLAGPPDAPAARAVARVRRVAAQASAPSPDGAPVGAVPADDVTNAAADAGLEIVDLRHLDGVEGPAGSEAAEAAADSGDSEDAEDSDVLDLTRTDAGRADR